MDKLQVMALIVLLGPLVLSERQMSSMVDYTEKHLLKKKTTLMEEEIELEDRNNTSGRRYAQFEDSLDYESQQQQQVPELQKVAGSPKKIGTQVSD